MIQKIDNLMKKIGKRNLALIILIICTIIISKLYVTFSLSTYTEQSSIINGVKTLKFILGNETEENTIILAAGSSKNIAITISNKEKIKLKYGIYYSSSDDLTDVKLGYHHLTEHLPTEEIEPEKDYIITIKAENNSNDLKTITFGLVYGLETGGDLVLEENQKFITEEMNFPLNEAEKGSYVAYIGNNGCTEEQCIGTNANDFDNSNGYCGEETNNFKDKGWRVAYTKKGSAHLISAGAPECIEQGEDTYEDFLKKIQENSENYCNMDYAHNGICNENSTWIINTEDFFSITNKELDEELCFKKENSKECGLEDDLINTGSNYWLLNKTNNKLFHYQNTPIFSKEEEKTSKGIRPIIKIADSVIVTKGKGTKEDPYQIKNTKVANYEYTIVYNGNGATSGDTEDSIHKTNTLQKLNKNNFSLVYQIKQSEFATFDDSYCDDDGTCHETSIQTTPNKEARFLGWSTDSTAIEPEYLDEQEVVNLSTSSNDIIVNLYAVWEFDAFKLPNIQEREGYDILGWYTEKEGGEKIGNPGDNYTTRGNITLYARWQKKTSL